MAAYLTALARTMPEVLRRTGYDGVEALRRAAPGLDQSITVATTDLRGRGVPAEKVPFARGIGTIEPKQKDIVGVINDKRYEDRLATLDEDEREQLRSASGSGSAAFLLMPTQQGHRIEDPLFRVAVVRKLGGRVSTIRPALTLRVIGRGGAMVIHSITGGSTRTCARRGATSSVATTVSSDGWRAGSRIASGVRRWSGRRSLRRGKRRTDWTSLWNQAGGDFGSTSL